MYNCTKEIIESEKIDEVLAIARRIIEEEKEKCSARKRPLIKGHKTKIKYYIDTFERHLDKKEIRNMAGRYSLTPCVFELLKFSNDQPQYSEGHNYFLTGRTPCGKDFKVIVRKKSAGYVLRTYFRT